MHPTLSTRAVLCVLAMVAAALAGVSPQASAIAGGTRVTDVTKYPFMAVVQGPDASGQGTSLCTGTLIRAHWVLTAAHCFVGADPSHAASLVPSQWQVILRWLGSSDPGGGTRFTPDQIWIDPSYTGGDGHDVALVHVADTAPVEPVRLATVAETQEAGTADRWAVGYGEPSAGKLREVRLDGSLSTQRELLNLRCVDDDHSVRYGDSGGPLLTQTNGVWVQLGVLMGDEGDSVRKCGFGRTKVTYANTSNAAQRAWISGVADVPSVPIAVTATLVDGGVRIAWAPPAETAAGQVRRYLVRWDDGLATQERSVPARRSSLDITAGLVGGVAYEFEVSALNDAGEGRAARVSATPGVVLPFHAEGWRYKIAATGQYPGFYRPGFDDTRWTSTKAGFGTLDFVCGWNSAAGIGTVWGGPGNELLVRKHFTVRPGAGPLRIEGSVDNHAEVYVNGALLQTPNGEFCESGTVAVDVPPDLVRPDNVVAVRGVDTGGSAYLDLRIIESGPLSAGPG